MSRARIRDAAVLRYGRDGFRVGLRVVAQDAGVSAALILHHFGFWLLDARRRGLRRRRLHDRTRDLIVKIIFCTRKFTHRLAQSACELRQFFGAEQEQNDQKKNQSVGPEQVGKSSEVHKNQIPVVK